MSVRNLLFSWFTRYIGIMRMLFIIFLMSPLLIGCWENDPSLEPLNEPLEGSLIAVVDGVAWQINDVAVSADTLGVGTRNFGFSAVLGTHTTPGATISVLVSERPHWEVEIFPLQTQVYTNTDSTSLVSIRMTEHMGSSTEKIVWLTESNRPPQVTVEEIQRIEIFPGLFRTYVSGAFQATLYDPRQDDPLAPRRSVEGRFEDLEINF